MMLKHNNFSLEAGDDVTPDMIVQDLKSQDVEKHLEAVYVARSILCEKDPPINVVVQAGIIVPLLEALNRDDCPSLQYRALGVLTNILFDLREDTMDLTNSGVIPKLITFLAHEGDLAECAIVTLGSLALHGAEARDAVLAHGAVRAMLPHMHKNTPVQKLRTIMRTFSIICSYDETNLELVSPALPLINKLLDMKDEDIIDLTEHGLSIPCRPAVWDVEDGTSLIIEYQQRHKHKSHGASDIVEDACTALANIMHCGDECVEAVQAVPGLTARLMALLEHEVTNVKEAALSAVGNMLGGTDAQVDRCLSANCLEPIVSLLQSSNTSLVQEAARATSNILAGTHSQIKQALDKDILTPLQDLLGHEDLKCRNQAGYAVTYLCINGTAAQRVQLVSCGVLEPYCALLATPDRTLAGEVLDSLDMLLQDAERDGNVKFLCYMLDEFDALDQIQTLQENTTDEGHRCKISNMSVTLRKHAREERSIVHDEEEFTLEKIVQGMQSLHQATQTRAARAAYYMLREQHPPIHALLEAGIMQPLMAGLDRDACSDLQNISAWVLSKITAGARKNKMAVANSGAIPKLLALLARGDKVAELASCSLGNMAAHGPETRDAVRAYIVSEEALTELRTYMQTYGNWCSQARDNPLEELELVLRALPFVSELLDTGDLEIMKNACTAFTNIMYGGDECIEAVQAVPRLTARLVALLEHEATHVQEAVLKVVKKMLDGTDTQTDRCLEAGCLDHLLPLLQCSEPSLVELAAGATSNMMRHSTSIQRAIDVDLLTTLLNILASGEAECQKLAAYAITNLCDVGTAAQRAQLVSRGVLEPYCALLGTLDPALAGRVLDGLNRLIQDAEENDKVKPLCSKLDKIGVIELLQALQGQEIIENIRLKAAELSVTVRQQTRSEHLVIEEGQVYTLAEIMQELKTQDSAITLLRAMRAARRMLRKNDASTLAMIRAGVVTPLVAALGRDDCPDLQQVATNALNLVAVFGKHKHRVAIVDSGVIPKLVALVCLGGKAAASAAWALGNMTLRSPVSRDKVLAHGAVGALVAHMRPGTPARLLRSCVGAYWDLCPDHISLSTVNALLPALDYISDLLLYVEDKDVQKMAVGSLATLMYSPDKGDVIAKVQKVSGLTERVVALLGHEATDVKEAALVAVTNMLGGTVIQAENCFEAGCLDHIVSHLRSSEPELVQLAAAAMCSIFSDSDSAELALEKGVLNTLLSILANAEPDSFGQFYTISALVNLTGNGCQEQKMAVVRGGAIPMLVAILGHGPAVAERAAKVLENITFYSPVMRDLVLSHGGMRAILPHMLTDTPVELLRMCMKVFANFCSTYTEDEPLENLELLVPALPHTYQLLNNGDEEVLRMTCRSFIELTKTYEGVEAVQAVPGLTARLVALLRNTTVMRLVINAVILMLAGTDTQVDRCLDADCFEHFTAYLQCRDRGVMKEAVGGMQKVLGESHPQIQRVMDRDALTPLMTILYCYHRGQIKMVKAIANLCRRVTAVERVRLVTCGVLEPYYGLLATPDCPVTEATLDSLYVLLRIAESDGKLKLFCWKLVEIGILDQMKLLQEHDYLQVREKARRLIQAYFPHRIWHESCDNVDGRFLH